MSRVSSDHLNDLKNLHNDIEEELVKTLTAIDKLQIEIADKQAQVCTLFQKVSILKGEKDRVSRYYGIRADQWNSQE